MRRLATIDHPLHAIPALNALYIYVWCGIPTCACHMQAPAADGVAIALDKFQEWPHDLDATTKLALYPQDDDFLWGLFERGQQDGISWAQQQGFPPEVLQRVAQGAAEVEELRVWRRSDREPTQQQQQQQHGDGQMKQQQQEAAAVMAAAEGMQEVQQEYIPAAGSSARH